MRVHALTEPFAVAGLIGAAAGNLTPREPLAFVLVAALALLAAVTAAKAILARIAARHRQPTDTHSITDVFDQVNAIWDTRGETTTTWDYEPIPDEVWNTDIEDWERDPIPGYIGRHRAPETGTWDFAPEGYPEGTVTFTGPITFTSMLAGAA